MFTAQQFGMTEIEFQKAKVNTRTCIDALMRDGGFKALENNYNTLRELDKYIDLSPTQRYMLKVIENILVMA